MKEREQLKTLHVGWKTTEIHEKEIGFEGVEQIHVT
jgi:hypothetical protein